ncbi:hypothetical protein [Leptospira santarosai]|uniref:hypothetical protein n=1 Tax=Leptospira santarosai TaxID=28183 RepID=UPI0002BDAAB0|nr:hypothetical protein [Leptospira santarosai]EMO83106.1 hypothetical protein LEP1GSC070_2237 [Leptospira santarosai str. AIM]MDI7226571.1 hypothetical protein [Leptospira santarosai]
MNRYQKLLSRRLPKEETLYKSFSESFNASRGENTDYILKAMAPVEKRFTDKLIEDGNRIESQISRRLMAEYPDLEFRRQGSVSNNTHIRFSSDVDVLVIIDKFYTVEPPLTVSNPYIGDPKEDLTILRNQCKKEMAIAFPSTEIDDSGAISISIKGGSISRKVDIVPANWYHSVAFEEQGFEYLKGVMVFNRELYQRISNFPFLFNYLIEEKDDSTNGVTRMLIRFLKSVKADEEEDGKKFYLSSYDICSLVYRMPESFLNGLEIDRPISIIGSLVEWLNFLKQLSSVAFTIKVVDESRLIFDKKEKLDDLGPLTVAINDLYEKARAESGNYFVSKAHFAEYAR